MMRKRASSSTMLGMARTRLCMSRPSGRARSIRSQYAFGKMCVKASIFIARLVALELRLLLGDERVVGALEVLGLHADRLRLGLGLERLLDRLVPFLVQALLGHGMRERRAVGQTLRNREGASEKLAGLD